MTLSHERAVDLAVAEIHALADVAATAASSRGGLAAPVPSCPGWSIADLLRHTGEVHRWAAELVRTSSPVRIPRDERDWGTPADDDALPAWIEAGADVVRGPFLDADPDTEQWAWGAPKLARFWPRRMVHETAVHRADVELAIGVDVPAIATTVAADGVDELLGNLAHAAYFSPSVEQLRGDGEVLAFVAEDAGTAWRVELLPEAFTWAAASPAEAVDGADAVVRGPATSLLLVAYRRWSAADGHDIEVEGSTALADHWFEHAKI